MSVILEIVLYAFSGQEKKDRKEGRNCGFGEDTRREGSLSALCEGKKKCEFLKCLLFPSKSVLLVMEACVLYLAL